MAKPGLVMAFGTFDLLHRGHLYYLNESRKLGQKLIVVVSRDEGARKVKGFKPLNQEKDRLAMVQALAVVDKAVLGDKKDFFAPVKRFKPDVLALGHDQFASKKGLRERLEREGFKAKVKRVKSFKPAEYKTRKIKDKVLVFKA